MSKKSFEIESFMTERLKLSGNDLVLYAIMWKETGHSLHSCVHPIVHWLPLPQ